jgi:hypothetical protein
MGGACGKHGRGEKIIQGFGEKTRRKEIARKTKEYMGEWVQNGS